MNSEFSILSSFNNNSDLTQRDIALITGKSLGNVNQAIKNLVKEGLLEIEKKGSRTIKYILTQQGIKKKAEITYKYLIDSCRNIKKFNIVIDKHLEGINMSKTMTTVLFGHNDEICEIISCRLRAKNASFVVINSTLEIGQIDISNSMQFIVWHPDFIETVKARSINFINILDGL
ncbi:MAG: winged helix-turn-helix transcriptional regulator [Bacillota bacterium]